MQQISLDWWRLLRYSLLFSAYLLAITVFILIWFSDGLADAWQKGQMLTRSQMQISLYLGLSLFIFISFPLLLLRFIFYFFHMLYRGRNAGVSVITYKTLFNPFNFLLFPSLLNPQGISCRTRCLWSLTLLVLLYFLMLLII
ncbi:MAG TPA: hypothetical protein VIS54_05670 [Psychromonas sp.]